MAYILSIIRTIIPKEIPTYLGRWKIEYCNVKINNIVKLANEDHCGGCTQYTIDTIDTIDKINITNKQSEMKGILHKIIT